MEISKLDFKFSTAEENFRPFFSSGFKSCTTSSSPKAIQLNKNVNINKYISMYLKDYQIEGVQFLYNAYLNNRGCILADDMGLGWLKLKSN